MTVAIKQNLVSTSKYSLKCPYPMDAEYITYHNTAMDAPAKNEISYMIGNNSATGYHFAVDDKEIVQGIPTNRNAYACGDGATGKGNRKSISVEVCYSKSGGTKYAKAEALAAKLIAQLLHERGWGTDRVKPHQFWSGKNCPHRILNEKRWAKVIANIQKELNALKGTVSKPAPAATRGYVLKGDKGDQVTYLQKLLNGAGYKVTVDGIFGTGTETAVEKVQEDNKITVDGIAGNGTLQVLEALNAKSNIVEKLYLQKGDTGAEVKELQQQLKDLKYAITVDGSFGQATKDDVEDFQSKNNLAVDGIAGKATRALLKTKVAESKKTPVKAPAKAPAKAPVKVASGLPSNLYGTVKVLADNLNVRVGADFSSKILKVVKKGESYKVYGQKNGLYNVGSGFVTSNTKYVKFTKNPNYKK